MNDRFEYYPLMENGLGGANKRALTPARSSAEAAYKISTFCLESFVPGMFSLLAKHPTTINTYHYFNIECPHCGAKLEPMTQAKDMHVLPMYACKYCSK